MSLLVTVCLPYLFQFGSQRLISISLTRKTVRMEQENPGNSVNPQKTGNPSVKDWLGLVKTLKTQQIEAETLKFLFQRREEKSNILETIVSLHKRQLDILNTMSKENHIIQENHEGNEDTN